MDAAVFLDGGWRRLLLESRRADNGRWCRSSSQRGRRMATRRVSLCWLDYGQQREIIVVDDASEPPLAQALSLVYRRLVRQEHNIGQSAARNLAAEAQGGLQPFIDNDCVADPAWRGIWSLLRGTERGSWGKCSLRRPRAWRFGPCARRWTWVLWA
jgi:hypothetical protein